MLPQARKVRVHRGDCKLYSVRFLGPGVDTLGEECAGGGGTAAVDDGQNLGDGAREGQAVVIGGH